MSKQSIKKILYQGIIGLFFAIIILMSLLNQLQNYYVFLSLIFLILVLLPGFIRFENREINAKETVIIATFSALAVVGRVPFAAIPSVQATSAIVMLVGYSFGAEIGFMVGGVSAIASNIVLGQGPWTPWQMFAFGMMGYVIGKLANQKLLNSKGVFVLIALAFGFVFGWIMNIWMVLGFVKPITLEGVIGIYAASFYFDLLHGITNAVVIFIALNPWNTRIERIKKRYRI